jgi:transcriptional regulator with XRE-family HTH domain
MYIISMKYLTQAQFARKHGVSRSWINQLVKAGKLPVYDYRCGVVLIDDRTEYTKKSKVKKVIVT